MTTLLETLEQVQQTVRELAVQYPTAVYASPDACSDCKYLEGNVKNGPQAPGCIFGQALASMPGEQWLPILTEIDTRLFNTRITDVFDSMFGFNTGKSKRDLSPEENSILAWGNEVQHAQDRGYTWKTAVKKADKAIKNIRRQK